MSRLKQLQEMAHSFNEIGAVSDETVKRLDTRIRAQEIREKLPKIMVMEGKDIRAMRDRLGISQAGLAYTMNMTVASISKWERGEKKPNGAALRLLNILDRKGIEFFAE